GRPQSTDTGIAVATGGEPPSSRSLPPAHPPAPSPVERRKVERCNRTLQDDQGASDFERGIRHATSLAMFERFAEGLGIPRPLLGLADSQHDHDEAAPGRTREEPPREIPAIRSVDFVAWLAEQSKTSFRVIYDRLAARIQQLARIPDPERSHRAYLYGRVTREQVVTALAQYYRTLPTDCTFYNVQVDGMTADDRACPAGLVVDAHSVGC
ncbi:MAG TPA: hypothetical protein VI074_06925, partial [Propionibacteriaceae bacterium]